MKKILLIALVAFTMFSCNQGITVSFDDPKSEAILSVYDSYMQNDAAAIESLYAEDAVVYLNSLDSIPIQDNVKNLAMHHELFDDDLERIEFSDNSRLNFNHDLTNLNWFNISGKSKIYLFANSLKDLSLFLKKFNNRGKIFILGAGSNTFFDEEIYNGVVIKLGKNFNNI